MWSSETLGWMVESSKKLSTREVAKLLEEITKDWKIDEIDNPELQKLLEDYVSIREEHKKFLEESLKQALDRGYTVKWKDSYAVLSNLFKQITWYDFPKYEDIISKNENYWDFIVDFDWNVLKFYKVWERTVFAIIDLKGKNRIESTNPLLYSYDHSFNNNTINQRYKVSINDLENSLSETTSELEKRQVELQIVEMEKSLKENILKTYENQYVPLPESFSKENWTYAEVKAKISELDKKILGLQTEIAELEKQGENQVLNVDISSPVEQQNPEQEQWQELLAQTSEANQEVQNLDQNSEINQNNLISEGLNLIWAIDWKKVHKNPEIVKQIQVMLNRELWLIWEDALVIDGKIWKLTMSKIKVFQEKNWLLADWRVWPETFSVLFRPENIGDKETAVAWIDHEDVDWSPNNSQTHTGNKLVV